MSLTGTRVTARPPLAVALLRAWRTWHEHDPLLVAGPAETAPTADSDRIRVLADLRTAPPET